MKKMFFMAATAALALSSCSSDDLVQGEQPVGEDGAVVFSAYSARQTRAAVTDLSTVQTTGFGVFAYDQGSNVNYTSYSATHTQPNFMYNQMVDWDNANKVWKYAPVKFFNNNTNAKHSFFAYAPYNASVNTVFSYNKAPQIRYTVATDDIDLLWGCEWKADGMDATTAPINKEKPGVSEKIGFNFKHALSQLTIKAAPFIDDVHGSTHDPSTLHEQHKINSTLAYGTKVALRSVTLVGTGIPTKGLLSLENGKWTIEETNESVYDFATDLMWDATTDAAKTAGGLDITARETVKDKMMAIPSDGHKFKIQVVYDVITEDAENPKNATSITNTILSDKEFEFVQGVAYEYHLDLGLTSVKFDAKVVDWNTANDIDVDLPNNRLEVVIASEYASVPTENVNFMGDSYSVPDVSLYTDGQMYYNTKDGKLYLRTTTGTPAVTQWSPVSVTTTLFMNNSVIYKVTNADGTCERVEAPRFIKVGAAYHMLVDGKYKEVTNVDESNYNTKKLGDFIQANPESGIYKIDGVLYYYVRQ